MSAEKAEIKTTGEPAKAAEADVEMKGEATKEDAPKEPKEEAPKEPEKPKELETDAIEEKKKTAKISDVTFSDTDCTLNALNSRNVISTLTEGGMQFLIAGARATAGIKSGRYTYEVRIIETMARGDGQSTAGNLNRPRTVVRLGFSHAGSSLLMGDGTEGSIFFDMDGFMQNGKNRKKVAQKFSRDDVVAVLLNLDPSSPNKNTISLFRDGNRICEPQPLPESLLGKALFPTVTFKSASLQVNFGPAPLAPLPFKCHMVGAAAKGDAEVAPAPKANAIKQEVVIPVGLPEQGFFDYCDAFLKQHPEYIELSDRMILDWAAKSGLSCPRNAGSLDKPEYKFGVPQMDDFSVRRVLRQIASLSNRSFIVPELQANLLATERKKVLKRFALPGFKKVARVIVGEPSAEHKAAVHALLLQDKTRKAEEERKKKVAEENRLKLVEERKNKVEELRKARLNKDGKATAEGKEEEKEPEVQMEKVEEPIVVELTDEEKGQWYRKNPRPDMSEVALAKFYANFSLPSKEEGFDEIVFEWQNEAAATKLITEWISAKKLTERVEDVKPGEWFLETSKAWNKSLATWKTLQVEWKNPAKKKILLAKREEAKKKEAEEKGEEPKEDMDIVFDDLDVSAVADPTDIGNGEPLFSNFAYEDWQLLAGRYELHLLVHSFRKDLDDPERTGFAEKDVSFYFNKYFKKQFSVKNFACNDLKSLVELMADTLRISGKNEFLEAIMAEETPAVDFIKLVETHRRDRQRRLDAGDETAELKFPRAAQAPTTKPPVRPAPWKGPSAPGTQPPARLLSGPTPPQKRPPNAAPQSAWASKRPRTMAWGQ